jgi:hypothetical protein
MEDSTDDLNLTGHSDGNESSIHLSFSGMSDSKEYNEEELKNIAEAMSPMVTSLFNTNDDFLSTNQEAWLEE